MRVRKHRGQSLVLLAAGVLVFLGFVAFVIDFGRAYGTRQILRNNADAASLAGAQSLPDATAAQSAASDYYARNLGLTAADVTVLISSGNTTQYRIGSDTVEVTTPYQNAKTQAAGIAPSSAIKVLACRTIGHHFGGLFGVPSSQFCSGAVAVKKSGTAGYGIWAAQKIQIQGNNNLVNGQTYSNQINVQGNNNTVSETASYVTSMSIAGSNNSITTAQTSPKPMPSVPNTVDHYKALAQANGTYFTGNKTYSTNNVTLSGVIFVEGGNLTITGNNISGTVTLVANGGKITFEGNNLNLTAFVDNLFAYVPTGSPTDPTGTHIEFKTSGSSTNNVFRGTLYAAEGDIVINNNNFDLMGTLIAGSEVALQKNNATVNYHSAFALPAPAAFTLFE